MGVVATLGLLPGLLPFEAALFPYGPSREKHYGQMLNDPDLAVL